MKAEELCTLFDHEFTFNKPCVGIRSVLYDGLEALIAGGMMSYAQSQVRWMDKQIQAHCSLVYSLTISEN
jgi:hypothetical protein